MKRLVEFPSADGGLVAVEFGVKLNAEARAFIASTAGEANFTINLTWTRKPTA